MDLTDRSDDDLGVNQFFCLIVDAPSPNNGGIGTQHPFTFASILVASRSVQECLLNLSPSGSWSTVYIDTSSAHHCAFTKSMNE